GIRDRLLELCMPDVNIRAWVRTGDTPARERQRMIRTPPHIIVTTPESLYILLTSDSGRAMLSTVKTVIVDEIHALAGNKRGAHLSLSLQRLESLCQRQLIRIGLSATQKPIEQTAHFLVGNTRQKCSIIDTGHERERDISLQLPESPLEAIMANEVWEEQYRSLVTLVKQHKTTLIFVNNRRLAERAAFNLAEQLGEENVTAHHGSLSREHRLDAEQRLKAGNLRALVATASLELGIDIGDIDLVCQIGSPRSINAFLQRVGRSGHSVGGIPKGRLFPLSRDDLVECTALLDAIRRKELDTLCIPVAPLDVIAQHIVAEVSAKEWPVPALFDTLTAAWPYRSLSKSQFERILIMLADGYSTRRGRRSAYIHYDRVNQRLRARRGARMTAIMNSGAIPDLFDYDVIMEPEGLYIGNLNEDFAFESLPGDIFQLGNTAYRILKIQQGKVFVQDAHGQPPTIPFWFGEVPGRSDELSIAVSRIRNTVAEKLQSGVDTVQAWLQSELKLPVSACEQLTEYLALAKACFDVVPSSNHLLFERFFDETGDMHFIIHAPLGSRINRAWGLALRKRFCRKFNFELQAAATEDNIILSLGPTHSFPLEEVIHYLKADTVRDLLVQALLDAPVFATRWRWICNIALAVPRMRAGKKVPAQFQRNDAEDLVAVIFPDQLACLENIAGNREIPDHPLVAQTINDCLHENMDITGLEKLLRDIDQGKVKISCFDLNGPSPLAAEIISAKP
ncbi:MAG: DEAD/DEAH box helicase, partial [Thiohalomonadales bacterium]